MPQVSALLVCDFFNDFINNNLKDYNMDLNHAIATIDPLDIVWEEPVDIKATTANYEKPFTSAITGIDRDKNSDLVAACDKAFADERFYMKATTIAKIVVAINIGQTVLDISKIEVFGGENYKRWQ